MPIYLSHPISSILILIYVLWRVLLGSHQLFLNCLKAWSFFLLVNQSRARQMGWEKKKSWLIMDEKNIYTKLHKNTKHVSQASTILIASCGFSSLMLVFLWCSEIWRPCTPHQGSILGICLQGVAENGDRKRTFPAPHQNRIRTVFLVQSLCSLEWILKRRQRNQLSAKTNFLSLGKAAQNDHTMSEELARSYYDILW